MTAYIRARKRPRKGRPVIGPELPSPAQWAILMDRVSRDPYGTLDDCLRPAGLTRGQFKAGMADPAMGGQMRTLVRGLRELLGETPPEGMQPDQ